MKRIGTKAIAWTLGSACFALAPPALALELLWTNDYSSYGDTVRSVAYPATVPVDEEAADDFQVHGTIERLIVYGRNDCTFGCFQPPQPLGVWVRFYASTPAGPGALEYEEFLAAGEPRFQYDATDGVRSLDLTLEQPFAASGWHFLAVQVEFGELFNWYRTPANDNAPVGAYAYWRDNRAGGTWQQAVDYWGTPVVQDLHVDLYGCPAGGCPDPPLVAGCGVWSEIPSPNPIGAARLEDVDVIAPWDVWAVGSFSGPIEGYWNDVQQSLAMHWNGSAWSIVPTPNPAPNPSTTQVDLVGVSGVSASDVWAVGRKRDQDAGGYTGGRMLAMHWDGFEWGDMEAPWPSDADGSPYTGASGEQFYDVVAIASNDVWMTGRYWNELPSGAILWPGVAMRWNGSGFERYLLPMASPSARQWGLAIAAVSSDDVWIVGDGDGAGSPLYTWHWDGSSWAHVPGPTPGTDRELTSVVALAADDVWAGGWYRDTSYTTFPLLLHWDGSSWSQVASPAGGTDLAAWASDDILTFGAYGWAHWDGTSWSATSAPQIIPSGVIRSLAIVSPCELWAVGWRGSVQGEVTLIEKLVSVGNPDDTDGDGVPNATDNCPIDFNPDQLDCDGDGAGDVCELTSGTAQDCNGNGTPDDCDAFSDCNGNDVPDECEADCNGNDLPDACDITSGSSVDCDADGVPDECETVADCNTNGVNDWCDIDGSVSADTNANGYPDECEALGPEFATVTTPDDVVDFGGARQVDDLPGPDGLVSFREALAAVNNTPGPQTVAFNVPPELWDATFGEMVTLRLENGMFRVTDDGTTVDFTTQTRFTGDTNPAGGEVGIYGFEVNAWGVTAMQVTANDCTIKGMGRVLQRGYGVQIYGNGNRVVGSTITGPLYAGVYVGSNYGGPPATGNVVGGVEPGEGNFLSAGNDGVRIDQPAQDNVVIGNVLDGAAAGVRIRGAVRTRVGGSTPAEGNWIRGAGRLGSEGCPTGEQVYVSDSVDTLIEGNFIGITEDGFGDFGQQGTEGIQILSSTNTVVRDNVIGGILVVGSDHCAGDRFGTAILVHGTSSGTVIEGNLIGTGVDGLSPVPNRAGIVAEFWPGSGTPTATLVRDNVVAYSELDGIRVGGSVTGVTISENSISGNDLLGISLTGGTGNGGQPAPVVSSVTTDDVSVTIAGTVSGAPARTLVVEFFADAACDPSGAGEGRFFLGSTTVAGDATGTASFEATFDSAVMEGEFVTATSTDVTTGNTSEFSTCETVVYTACSGPPPAIDALMVGGDRVTLYWSTFGPSVQYDVARGTVSGMRSGQPASCLATGVTGGSFADETVPEAGETHYYMVRGRNECGAGPWGGDGSRSAACP